MNQSHSPYGSLRVRVAVADALLATVSAGLAEAEIDAVLDCGFSSTLAAVRNADPLLDWSEFPGRSAL